MPSLKYLALTVVLAAPMAAQTSSTATTSATPPTAAVVASPPKPFTAAEEAKYMALGRRAASFMAKKQADSLLAMMEDETGKSVGGLDGIKNTMASMEEKIGTVTKVLVEKMTRRNGMPQFWHEAEYSNFTDEPGVTRFVFSEEGKIIGLGTSAKSKARFDS